MNLRKKARPAEWPKAGLYWFLHHNTVLEWTHDIDERWDYVCQNKPLAELPERQRWMRPVEGALPDALLTAWENYDTAGKKFAAAREKYIAAREKYIAAGEKYWPQIKALMRIELPGVPWDGERLLFGGKK